MKILIIRLSSIGDIVLTQPIIKLLHTVFPQAELFYLIKKEYADIPSHFGVPLNILVYEKNLKFHSQLYKIHFHLVIDLHNKLSTFIIRLFSIKSLQFVYNKKHLLRLAIIHKLTDKSISSTLQLYQTALQKAAKRMHNALLNNSLDFPVLVSPNRLCKSSMSFVNKDTNIKLIALFPGANHPTKRYPTKYFDEVIKMSPQNWKFLLLGNAADMSFIRELYFANPQKTEDLGNKYDLNQIIFLISTTDVVLSNDSGPMHIAAALSKPQIAIFGATHPRLGFTPLNPKAHIICKNLSCQPCTLHGDKTCPQKHFNCMLSIKPHEIFNILFKILESQ